jgi:heptosyltransferase III
MARRILILRRENIGDLVLTTPFIRALRDHLPDAHLAALVNSYNAPVLDGNPDLNAVYAYTKGKHADSMFGAVSARLGQAKLLWSLRQQRFDDVVLAEPTYTPRNIRFARFILAGRAGTRIVGFEDDDGLDRGLDVVVRKHDADGLHQAELMFRLGTAYGFGGRHEPTPRCRVFSGAATKDLVDTHQPAELRPLRVGLQISARKPSQRWSAESFAALAAAVHSASAERALPTPVFSIFWSPGSQSNPLHPGDDEKASQLQSLLATALPAGAVQAAVTETLAQLIAGMAPLDMLVSADGGAMHIAAGLGKPVVALFGDSDPVRWRPWGVPHRVLQAASREVSDLSVAEVMQAFDALAGECGFAPANPSQ